ncbi:MAG TPA: hypothetical protein VIJ87_02790 [Pyrinomonadaceae bacterium]|jgi:hypothetical protein
MKSENRKVQMTLLGVVVTTPFLVLASVVGAHITSLADNVRVDVLCVAIAFVSIAMKMVDGLAFRGRTEQEQCGDVETNGNTALRVESTTRLS